VTSTAPPSAPAVRSRAAASDQSSVSSLRLNNFDLIRLFGALQVLLVHGIWHLHVESWKPFAHVLDFLPGVPIFFAVSGYLVSASWERAPSAGAYARNRALRIYPALWTSFALSVLILFACGVRPNSVRDFVVWSVAQLSFVQFYNPDFIRGFGVGVINGSAWTIPVELQFYLVIPLLALIARGRPQRWLLLLGVSALLMFAIRSLGAVPASTTGKLLTVTVLPYLFYFLVGVVLRYAYEWKPRLLRGKVLFWAFTYAVWVTFEVTLGIPGATGNRLNPLSIVLVGSLGIAVAYSAPALGERILRGNDISYGVYIYHMPLVNLILFLGMEGIPALLLALASALLAATLSWRFIERPALRLKGYSLRMRNSGYLYAHRETTGRPPASKSKVR
jgi:peptidoglycan/LPS O-acetylase OafA/YrhL